MNAVSLITMIGVWCLSPSKLGVYYSQVIQCREKMLSCVKTNLTTGIHTSQYNELVFNCAEKIKP